MLFNIHINDQPLPAFSEHLRLYADDHLAIAMQDANFRGIEHKLQCGLHTMVAYYVWNSLNKIQLLQNSNT